MSEIKSPATGSPSQLKKNIAVKDITDAYSSLLGMDVRPYFKKAGDYIQLYQCPDTGLQFFQPPYVAGDSKFYETLSLNDWYYEENRWDFTAAVKYIPANATVLEIGSGKGFFLEKIRSIAAKSIGLELNEESEKFGKDKGFEIRNETIEYFSNNNGELFDIVATFQVLEHVYEVKSFIDAALKVLKPRGKLIISVPNNKSILFDDVTVTRNTRLKETMRYMNMPPHHMGKWDKEVFESLSKFFPVTLKKVEYEPIHDYTIDLISEIYDNKFKEVIPQRVLRKMVRMFKKNFRGHTIMVVFEKK